MERARSTGKPRSYDFVDGFMVVIDHETGEVKRVPLDPDPQT